MALPEEPVAAFASAAGATWVLAIGGLDPRGAAGLVRDFLTLRALGANAYLVPTAYTIQSPEAVAGVDVRLEDELRHALAAALTPTGGDGGRGAGPAAVKIGMVGAETLVAPLVQGLIGFRGPVVYDPVLAASNGGSLYVGAIAALRTLISRATLITPNRAEAQALSGLPVTDLHSARAAARKLLGMGARAVLVKGGHLGVGATPPLAGAPLPPADDLLVTSEGEQVFSLPRLPDRDPRGTGCALASAIALELARGKPLPEAVGMAKRWVRAQIASARAVGNEHWL